MVAMLKPGNTYYELYYHVVFATKLRLPMLTIQKVKCIREITKTKANEIGFLLHILNGHVDHIHALITVPPALPLARVIKHIKGVSSRQIDELYWHEGYWVQGVEKPNVAAVASYIEKQQEHHARSTREEWEPYHLPGI
ncbi:MAG: IS200/IS605 family transposase [Spirochaetota bacterium]